MFKLLIVVLFLLKGAAKAIKNETKKQTGGILGMLLGALGASLLGNLLSGKGIVGTGYGNKEGKGMLRAGYRSKKILIPPHPLANFEIQKSYQNESRFNGAYAINLDEYADVGIHWIAFTEIEVIYFDSFGVEPIPKEIKEFIGNKNIKANVFRI